MERRIFNLLERGISLELKPVETVAPAELTAVPPKPTLELAASALMAKVAAEAQQHSIGKV